MDVSKARFSIQLVAMIGGCIATIVTLKGDIKNQDTKFNERIVALEKRIDEKKETDKNSLLAVVSEQKSSIENFIKRYEDNQRGLEGLWKERLDAQAKLQDERSISYQRDMQTLKAQQEMFKWDMKSMEDKINKLLGGKQ